MVAGADLVAEYENDGQGAEAVLGNGPTEHGAMLLDPPVELDAAATRRIRAAVQSFAKTPQSEFENAWLRAILCLIEKRKPNLLEGATAYAFPISSENLDRKEGNQNCFANESSKTSSLEGLGIGQISAVYEALLAQFDSDARKAQGQFFTPDDVASQMASFSEKFPAGTWLDPCCGVGNLAWHLAAAQPNPTRFVAEDLHLGDVDPLALKTAVLLIGAGFADSSGGNIFSQLGARAHCRDYLKETAEGDRVKTDFVIANPPYAAAPALESYKTGSTKDVYAYFFERIATSTQGFIVVTPASFVSKEKFASLREVLLVNREGADVMVFDNVPDTLFRGFKYGSINTSKTNFVRAAITVSAPNQQVWRMTPILRWKKQSRRRMLVGAANYLRPLTQTKQGIWLKLMPGTEPLWRALAETERSLKDLLAPVATDFMLEVATTPRYYTSATKRPLSRASKITLYFFSEDDQNEAYLVLNSSLLYWWWRSVDGGVTLTKSTLLSTPLPARIKPNKALQDSLETSEGRNLVFKLNAGRKNENVKHDSKLVARLNAQILDSMMMPEAEKQTTMWALKKLYSADMFAAET